MFKIGIYSLMMVGLMRVAHAQDTMRDIDQFKRENIGLTSKNTTLLNTVDFKTAGESKLFFEHTQGEFKHPLLAREKNGGGFYSERYQDLKDWKVYGMIAVNLGSEKDVPHTTQLNPLRINPYIVVDSLMGDWNKQDYQLQAKLVSPLFKDRYSFGIGLNYAVATGARQRDPRPQNTNNSLELAPSFLYKLSEQHHIGVNGIYRHFIEDLSVSNVNRQFTHNMYKLIGVGEYVGSMPTFMSVEMIRRYNGNLYGGGLQYVYAGTGIKVLGDLYINSNKEDAIDGSATPLKAGRHAYLEYGINMAASLRQSSLLHRVDFTWNQKDVDNTEYHQYQDPESRQFVTLFSNVFNTNLITTSDLQYNLTKYKSEQLNWVLGISGAYAGWDNKYSSNRSQQTVDRIDYGLTGTKFIYFKDASRLNFTIKPAYSQCVDSEFAYDEKAYATNFVAKNILYPTNSYLSADYWTLDAEAQYTFKTSKKSPSNMYVRLSGAYSKAIKEIAYYPENAKRVVMQVTVGMLSF